MMTVNVSSSDLGQNILPAKAVPGPDEMKAALRAMAAANVFENRNGTEVDQNGRLTRLGWRETGMALKATYGPDLGYELWELTHFDDRAREDAPGQWASFSDKAIDGHVTIASVIKAAKDNGVHFQGRTSRQVSSHVSYGPFTMEPGYGLTKQGKATRANGGAAEAIWICRDFEILGACRDPEGSGWGKQIRFADADGRIHVRYVSDAALHGDPATLCAALANEGLEIDRAAQRELTRYLSAARVDRRVTIVDRTGWHEIEGKPAFVLPQEVICETATINVILDQKASGSYETCGTIADWKARVCSLTSGHSIPVFFMSAALVGPLLRLVGIEGGGVHVFGRSSIGKSAILYASASVWGRGRTSGFVRSWRATANALEGAAASSTDTCLILDEMGVGEAKDVSTGTYSLSNGVGKARAARDGGLRKSTSWRVFVLSSGELPLAAKITEERGRKARAGQLVRLLDLPADRGRGFGAFDSAGSLGGPGKLADALKEGANSAFGTAGPEFVRKLLSEDPEKIAKKAKSFIARFTSHVLEDGGTEQILRAAKTFAMIGLAGEFATRFGVTCWDEGEASEAAKLAFERWLEQRGGTEPHEARQAIDQVRLIIEQHGEARFENLDGDGFEVRDRLGWRKGRDGENREWWVPSEVWKTEFCKGLDPVFVARTLAANGMLRRQNDGHLQCVVAIKQMRIRAYVLNGKLLSEDVEQKGPIT